MLWKIDSNIYGIEEDTDVKDVLRVVNNIIL